MAHYRPSDRPPIRPRRVRGGVRLASTEATPGTTPLGRQVVELLEASTDEGSREQGLDYARQGQVGTWNLRQGRLEATVQGRAARPYRLRIEFPPLSPDDWDGIANELSREARFSAALLAGDLPEELVDALERMGLRPIPATLDGTTTQCTCTKEAAEGSLICKHLAAALYILADRLDRQPLTLLDVRGIERDALVERLRMERLLESGGGMAQIVEPIDIPEAQQEAMPLESTLDEFWHAGPELIDFAPTLMRPEVPHALLRRLGPSPFAAARFPLVGLLATCYDITTEAVLAEQLPEDVASDGGAASE